MADDGLREKMLAGNAPSTPDDWRELAVLLAGLVAFVNSVHDEMDALGEALEAQAQQIQILVAQSSPDLQALLKAAAPAG